MRTNTPTGRVLVPLDGSELAEAILPLLERTHHPWGSEAVLIRSVTMDAAASSPAGKRRQVIISRPRRAGGSVRACAFAARGGTAIRARRSSTLRSGSQLTDGEDRIGCALGASPAASSGQHGSPSCWSGERCAGRLTGRRGSSCRWDWSTLSAAILTVVARLPQPLQGVVELLHVLDVPRPAGVDARFRPIHADAGLAAAWGYLERVAARLARKGFDIESVAVVGPVGPAIAERAAAAGADLVAMTTHNRSGVARLLLGSVAEHVLRTADVPVLPWKAAAPPVGARRERRTEEARHASGHAERG